MINKLEICGLTKRFGEKTLFEDLDLTLAEPAILWVHYFNDTFICGLCLARMDLHARHA